MLAPDHPEHLDVVRITKSLNGEQRRRAAAEQISTSALVRRLLTRSVHEPAAPVLTGEQVEQVQAIARRVAREFVVPGQ
jgi:hypothetical protein